MRRIRRGALLSPCLLAMLAATSAPLSASDQIPPILQGDIHVELQPIASGLTAPNLLIHAGDGSGRLFVVDQPGQIHLLGSDGVLTPQPFLDVSSRLVDLNPNFDERGLLGLAFHPDFAVESSTGFGRLYTYTSEPLDGAADFTTTAPMPAGTDFNHQSVLTEWQVDPLNSNAVDPDSGRELLRIDQPQFNHNAGGLKFRASDGYLYMTVGDGGGARDLGDGHSDGGNGQDLGNIHGSIVRIDPLHPSLTTGSTDPVSANGQYRVSGDNPFVSDSGAVDEIYAYGLRNPWRFSFDAPTDRLIIADVGQNAVEEINLGAIGGNFGWPVKEGSFLYDQETNTISNEPVNVAGLIDPIAQYATNVEGQAIIGGFVYRGSLMPQLEDKYIFGDWSSSFGTPSGRLFYYDFDDDQIYEFLSDELDIFILGFGQDADGELYVLGADQGGITPGAGFVFKIIPEPTSLALIGVGSLVLLRRRRA